jgi:hypothetical protein
MSLLLAVFEPATTAASMAICRPEAIDDAPAGGPEHERRMVAVDFLASRGMGEAQGKKVDPSAVAAKAIEAQPSFGQIKPLRGRVAWAEQNSLEETWRTSNGPHKSPGSLGEGEETLSPEKAGSRH